MKLTIDQILEKAFTTSDLANGGLLLPDQAATFVQGIIDKSIIIPECRRVPMKANVKQIDKITYASDILQTPNAVGTAPTSVSKPTTSKVTLTAAEVICAIDLGYDSLEDNIEGDGLFNTIMELTSKEIAFEMDKLILNGEVAGGTSDYLEILDGVFELISTYSLDAAEATLSDTVLNNAFKLLPGKYADVESDLRYYVSHKARLDFIKCLADKNVSEAFTRYLIEAKEPAYQGVPVRKVPAISTEDIDLTTVTLNGSKALLINPKNIVFGVHRDITYEMQKQPRKRIVEVTITMRIAVELEEEEACVKITDIAHSV